MFASNTTISAALVRHVKFPLLDAQFLSSDGNMGQRLNPEMDIVLSDDDFDCLVGGSNLSDGSSFNFGELKDTRRRRFLGCSGRFGGDVGNRKRRECERSDCDIDHAQLRQLERKATRQAIEEGIAEFYSGEFRTSGEPRKRRGKRGGANRSRRQSPVATTAGVDQFVETSRTGHLVAVTVLPANCSRLQRKKALASIGRTLPKLDSASIRARLGLA